MVNIIAKRIKTLLKLAALKEDLKSFSRFKKYFTTKEEDSQDFYIQEQYDEFYVYQDPPLGVSDILFGKCCCICMKRRGYDDAMSFAGVYAVNDNGNIKGSLMGYKQNKGTLGDLRTKIQSECIKGYGKLYLTGNKIYSDFESMKEYAQEQVKKKDKNLSNK